MNHSQCNYNLNEINCKFNNKKCYGGYCWKHRKQYLMNENGIILDNFTVTSKDYTIQELTYFCKNVIKHKKLYKYKKQDYFELVCNYYYEHKYPIQAISKVQSYIRLYLLQTRINLHGIASLNRGICNNTEDFYTYDPIQDIDYDYFISYKDTRNNYWGFDIRSLKKLIDMNYNNPYTIEEFSNTCKETVTKLLSYLDKHKISSIIINTVVSDRLLIIKQRFVDFFSQMEYAGYSCDVDWILNLNASKLKTVYRGLEDIWNYRANLSQSVKREIAPPDGQLFVMPVSDYIICNNKLELQDILSIELLKICNASGPNMNLGFMYVIIALCTVSKPCYLVHSDWVKYVF